MPKTPDPDTLIALSERAGKLAALKDNPSWAELRATVHERRDFHMRNMLKRLTNGSEISQREIDRHAGFWKGVEFVLDNPDMIEKKLETALRLAQQNGDTSE